ncbi:MAG TPA: S1C family serine protease [Lacipirellula sp.]
MLSLRSSQRIRIAAAFVFATTAIALANCAPAASLHNTIRDAQRKVVKIYGAGGLSGLEAYQTGILISSEGHVLTVQSYVLDTDDLAIVLDDGRKRKGELLGSDPFRELAVLKLQLDEDAALPHFNLNAAPTASVGDRVLALSNLFNIAGGDEPVSVLHGVVTALAPLDARRGAFESAFRGRVYIVDAAANNPGAAGGALVNWQGELLGLLGKELRSRSTGAWLHYAIPVDQFIDAVDTMRRGESLGAGDLAGSAPAEPLKLADLGVALVPELLPRTPPYIDAVHPGSAADRAGLRRDDLVVFVEGEATASYAAVVEALGRHEKFDAVRISVLRDGELIEASLDPEAAVDESDASEAESSDEQSGEKALEEAQRDGTEEEAGE